MDSPLGLRTFEVTVEFEGTLSDEAFEILAGVPAPRRAVEGEEPRERAFIPGRRIEYRWVRVDHEGGFTMIREDAFAPLVTDG